MFGDFVGRLFRRVVATGRKHRDAMAEDEQLRPGMYEEDEDFILAERALRKHDELVEAIVNDERRKK
ncbi:MAG: hypothetical protein A2V67_12610 [Deltaproteobacteria bacterium RBG_13_61_14]|nr:MAG: hypothetical protein A2V67_12610 [Deltaproteobacteria bacterium RBG_13_61_14]